MNFMVYVEQLEMDKKNAKILFCAFNEKQTNESTFDSGNELSFFSINFYISTSPPLIDEIIDFIRPYHTNAVAIYFSSIIIKSLVNPLNQETIYKNLQFGIKRIKIEWNWKWKHDSDQTYSLCPAPKLFDQIVDFPYPSTHNWHSQK